jgi:hypothetical protein
MIEPLEIRDVYMRHGKVFKAHNVRPGTETYARTRGGIMIGTGEDYELAALTRDDAERIRDWLTNYLKESEG